jgi:glycerol dehydrogenase
MVLFGGECCNSEIFRITQQVRNESLDVIVGAGGGKTADTAKVLSIKLDLPVVIAPTIASNDAPTSHFPELITISKVRSRRRLWH